MPHRQPADRQPFTVTVPSDLLELLHPGSHSLWRLPLELDKPRTVGRPSDGGGASSDHHSGASSDHHSQVSGLRVIASWLDYRMKDRGGKKSSPLDDIRPDHWTPAYTGELLELLWILERTLALGPIQTMLLDDVIAGPIFDSSTLAPVSEEKRGPPPVVFGQGALFVVPGEQPQLDQSP
jgi:hypothetical protein